MNSIPDESRLQWRLCLPDVADELEDVVQVVPDVLPHDADEGAELAQEVVDLAVLGLADRLVLGVNSIEHV